MEGEDWRDEQQIIWMEEVEGKRSLRWYRMVKEEADLDWQYTRSIVGQESLRLRLILRTSSVELMVDQKRCRMSVDDPCVLCNSEKAEGVRHFLIRCEEFASERQRLLDKIDQVEGTEELLEEYYRAEDEGRTALLLGRRLEGMADQV